MDTALLRTAELSRLHSCLVGCGGRAVLVGVDAPAGVEQHAAPRVPGHALHPPRPQPPVPRSWSSRTAGSRAHAEFCPMHRGNISREAPDSRWHPSCGMGSPLFWSQMPPCGSTARFTASRKAAFPGIGMPKVTSSGRLPGQLWGESSSAFWSASGFFGRFSCYSRVSGALGQQANAAVINAVATHAQKYLFACSPALWRAQITMLQRRTHSDAPFEVCC